MSRFILISGCSGGGKSTLINALAAQGHAVVPEPGRRLIAAGLATPWDDLAGFARLACDMARRDLGDMHGAPGWVFFDRGLIDAAVALAHSTETALSDHLTGRDHYHDTVFLAPPWPEIYRADLDRRHGFDAAIAEYDRLQAALPQLGYSLVHLPKTSPAARVAFVLNQLG